MDSIIVHGHSVTLEERICANGCGRSFKVLATSPIRTARSDCNFVCLGEKMTDKEKKKKNTVPLEGYQIADRIKNVEAKTLELEKNLWNACIGAAGKFSKSDSLTLLDKMEIALKFVKMRICYYRFVIRSQKI